LRNRKTTGGRDFAMVMVYPRSESQRVTPLRILGLLLECGAIPPLYFACPNQKTKATE
jgi:hypothetical protein